MADIDGNLPTKDTADGLTGSTVPTIATQVAGTDGANLRAVSTDTTGKLNINNVSGTLSLPTGAATSANQATEISSLASLDSKLNSLGQKVSASSVPVVLSSDQNVLNINTLDGSPSTLNITALDTSSTTVSGANSQVFIIGTPTAGSSASFSFSSRETIKVEVTGIWTGTLQSEISVDSGTTWILNGIHQTGTVITASSFTGNFAGGLNVSGATNFRVRAITSFTGTAIVRVLESSNTNSVYIANPVKLVDANLSIQANIKAASTSAIATDTSIVVALSPNSNNITNISGTVSLPTGASTATLQSTGNSSLASLDSKLTSLGQKTLTTSVPVILASDQTGINTFLDKNGSGTIIALNGSVTATTNGCASVTFDVTGTWVATITLEATIGDGNWFIINGDVDSTDSITSTFTVNTFLTIPCGSFSQVRLRASLFTSGTVAIAWNAGVGDNTVEVFNTNYNSLLTTSKLSDASGNLITSTLLGSKQAVDVSTKSSMTGSSPTSVTIGVSSAVVVASNSGRKGLVLINTSSLATVSFHVNGGSAVLNTGITLYPHGIWLMDEYTYTTGAINGISSLASTVISIQEFT